MDKLTIRSLANDIRNGSNDALSKLAELVENGNPDAMNELGKLYMENQFLEDNHFDNALGWYELAANNGSTEAMNILGVMHFKAAEYQTACQWFELAIKENNDPGALTNLGKMYSEGLGVEQNHNKAISLYREAAEAGENEAMFCLGECYYHGLGVIADNGKEIEWFTKAAEANNVEAFFRLGKLYNRGWGVEKNKAKAMEWYRKVIEYYETSAKSGDIYAINQIAEVYCKHLKEYDTAVTWYTEAAKLGNDKTATYKIAEIYDEKIGDIESAIEWYEKAADLGNGDAAFRLSQLYSDMDEDDDEIVWLEKSYQLGRIDALYFLGYLYKDRQAFDNAKECFLKLTEFEDSEFEDSEVEGILGLGLVCEELGDYNEARKFYEQLVESGNPEGMLAIGEMYENGKGVKLDIDQAARWYQQAYEAGDYSAHYKMKTLMIIDIITKSAGILQTDIYKQFPSNEKDDIMNILKSLDKATRIIRVKSGVTYKLFVK